MALNIPHGRGAKQHLKEKEEFGSPRKGRDSGRKGTVGGTKEGKRMRKKCCVKDKDLRRA